MDSLPVPLSPAPSAYERQALADIARWKNPSTSRLGKTVERVNETLHAATDLVRKLPGVDWTIDNVVSGVLHLTNEIMHDTVWRDGIYQEYQAAGHAIEHPDDLHDLPLDTIDEALQGLDTKYRGLAAAQGAAAGYAGLAGILPDVLGLIALNLRAVGEYATYCGYDIAQPAERYFALQLLNLVSQPAGREREAALVPLTNVSRAVARQQTVQTVEQFAVSGAMRGVARALGLRLTGAKLTQVMPMTSAFVAGSFNAYYTTRVCDAAYYLYRERWLIQKYGVEIAA